MAETVVFDRTTVGEANTVDAWRSCMAPFLLADLRRPDGPFRDTFIRVSSLGEAVFVDHQFNAAVFQRDRKRIAVFDNDCIGVCLWLSGQMHLENGSTSFLAFPGSIFLMDMGQPIFSLSTAARCFLIVFPKPLLWQCNVDTDKLSGMQLPDTDCRTAIFRQTLLSVFQVLPEIQDHCADSVLLALSSLLTGLIGADERYSLTDRAENLATSACVKRFIEANLSNPHLSAKLLTKHFPLSRSVLYRMFEPHQGVANYIRARRLRRCYRILNSARSEKLSIAKVSQSMGFVSHSHFSDLFKATFGETPQIVRDRALSVCGELDTALGPPMQDKLKKTYQWFTAF